jgi:hypothetical protein
MTNTNKIQIIMREYFKNVYSSWVPVAHACNPSYSRGRDQEDQGLMPAQLNSS